MVHLCRTRSVFYPFFSLEQEDLSEFSIKTPNWFMSWTITLPVLALTLINSKCIILFVYQAFFLTLQDSMCKDVDYIQCIQWLQKQNSVQDPRWPSWNNDLIDIPITESFFSSPLLRLFLFTEKGPVLQDLGTAGIIGWGNWWRDRIGSGF